MEKILIKKELEYYKLSTTKNKKYLQFSFKSFQILNGYIIVFYEYLLPWVAMIILSNIFIFIFILYGCYYLFIYYLFFFVFIKIF